MVEGPKERGKDERGEGMGVKEKETTKPFPSVPYNSSWVMSGEWLNTWPELLFLALSFSPPPLSL